MVWPLRTFLLTGGRVLPKTSDGCTTESVNTAMRIALEKGEEAAMPSCPECESDLDIELDEVEEGDVVSCEECGTEYEVVGVEPLELARVDEELDEDNELFEEDEEEE
jgi:alpha-aminoadipate carrier protein LysW